MKRPIFYIFIFLALLFLIPSVYAETLNVESLDDLIKEALRNNPQVLAAYSDWIAQGFKAKYSGSLPDPVASFSYFGDNIETKVGPQEAKYGLAQKVPFPGKLKLKAQAQAKGADIFKQKYEEAERKLIREVKFAYYDLFWVDAAIQITEEEKSLLESLEKVAQRRYESNLAPQQDVIKAHVELSRLIDKLFLLRQNRRSLAAKMNNILNRPQTRALGKTGNVEPLNFEYNLEQLHKRAQESSQQLKSANLGIERAEYEKSLAQLNYLPDFTLGLDYIQIGGGHTALENDGEDAWMGKVAVNVPIWFGKLRNQLEEKEAKLTASKKNYESIESNIVFEVEDLYFKITTYREIISLYETALLPQTEQSFQATKTAYETGKVDFLNWLDAERTLLQTRLAYYKAIVDYQKSIAYLERVVGKEL